MLLSPPPPTNANPQNPLVKVALPFDMAKTIIQAVRLDKGEPLPAMASTMARLVRDGGFQRLYMGWPVAFGRGIPGAAIMLATHTYTRRVLDAYYAPGSPLAGDRVLA